MIPSSSQWDKKGLQELQDETKMHDICFFIDNIHFFTSTSWSIHLHNLNNASDYPLIDIWAKTPYSKTKMDQLSQTHLKVT
jgi:hypothetical protein